MKALSRLLILFLSLVLQSCLPDPVAPSNEPNPPTISFGPEMPSRLFIQLSGSYTPRPDIVEYGFEIAENAFSGTADTLIINPPKDSETSFSCTLQLKPGMKYVFRSYLASTLRKKYSQEITRQMPTTSAALLSEVSFQKGRLTAVLLDDGGRPVNETGFCYGKTPDLKEMKKNRIPCALEEDSILTARIPGLEFGETYYFRAYAENAEKTANEVYAYSPSALSLTCTEDFPAPIADPVFERYLTEKHDLNGDGAFSYRELGQLTSIRVCTDSISSVAEIRQMPLLKSLFCQGSAPGQGSLDTLDISANPLLETLHCQNNRLTSLDASNNPVLAELDCSDNPLLAQIWLCKGQPVSLQYDTDIATVLFRGTDIPHLNITIDDPNFRSYLLSSFDKDKNDWLSKEEVEAIDTIDICTDNIRSITEVKHFTRLTKLICSGTTDPDGGGRGELTELDLSGNPSLAYLNCDNNQLLSVDVSQNPKLAFLSCQCNQLSALDVRNNPGLTTLACNNNQLSRLDVSQNPNLTALLCEDNQLTELDVSGNLALRILTCFNNPYLKTIWLFTVQSISLQYDEEVSKIAFKEGNIPDDDPDFPVADPFFRTYLFAYFDTDKDGHLSISEREAITKISICTDEITSISEIRFFPNLRELICCGTEYTQASGCTGKLVSLDVSHNPNLLVLECDFNQLVELDVSENSNLQTLSCSANPIKKLLFGEATRLTRLQAPHTNLTLLDLTPLTQLKYLTLSYSHLTELDVTPLSQLLLLDLYYNDLVSLDLSQNPLLSTLDIGANYLKELDLSHNAYLCYLQCRGEIFEASRIYKNEEDRIIVQRSISNRARGLLTGLDLSHNPELQSLQCNQNQLTALHVSHNPKLEFLRFSKNKISAIDLRQNPGIYDIECNDNLLKELDVSNKSALVNLYCGGNQLSVLDVSGSPFLKNFHCANNRLTILDVSNNASLSYLNCTNNPTLSVIWLKNGQSIANFQYDSTVSTVLYK